MKRIIYLITIASLTYSCADKFEYNTDFTSPTELNSPASIALDVTSPETIVLEWNGGGASDGSIVQYEVLFAESNGSFDNPIQTMQSDLGALPKLTLTHAQLNIIARWAGIATEQTGNVKWTVKSSKAGVVKTIDISKSIAITRGAGIDNIPENLYLFGTGAAGVGETEGRAFRRVADGVFRIYTNLANGNIHFQSSTVAGEGFEYYGNNGKIKEGNGNLSVVSASEPVRIVVDFNTISVTTEAIANVRCIWGATYDVIGNLAYIGNGKFEAANCAVAFIDPSRPETNPPSWLGWTEERYYFIANVEGSDKCWGRKDGVSPERPVGGESLSFYELGEFAWDQWEHLWKMSGALDMKSCTITINTNLDGLMVHQFSDIR
jgi:hypothetical protein